MDSIKPGIETSEFWATLFAQIVGLGLAMGILSPGQASAAASQATSVGGVAVMLITLVSYIASRTLVKRAAAHTTTETPPAPLAVVPTPLPYAQQSTPPPLAPLPALDSPTAPSYTVTPRIVPPVAMPDTARASSI